MLVEDDAELGKTLSGFMENVNSTCEHVQSISDALMKVDLYEYDIALIDRVLPDGDGLEVIKELKNKGAKTGIIIISAMKDTEDKVTGLNTGADDYLPKPFHFSELNARIFSLFRRLHFDGNKSFHFKEISIYPEKFECSINGRDLKLTRKEYDLLLFLLSNKNRVLNKELIATHIWGDNYDLVDSFDFVYNHVKNLRKKIKERGGSDYIKTIYGIGYKFESN